MDKTGHWFSGFGWGLGIAMAVYLQSWKSLIPFAVFGLLFTFIVNIIFYKENKGSQNKSSKRGAKK